MTPCIDFELVKGNLILEDHCAPKTFGWQIVIARVEATCLTTLSK